MKCPIDLKTKSGVELYDAMAVEYHRCTKTKEDDPVGFSLFIDKMMQSMSQIEQQITSMLNNTKKYKMDETDTAGWNLYNELTDKYYVFKYFGSK